MGGAAKARLFSFGKIPQYAINVYNISKCNCLLTDFKGHLVVVNRENPIMEVRYRIENSREDGIE